MLSCFPALETPLNLVEPLLFADHLQLLAWKIRRHTSKARSKGVLAVGLEGTPMLRDVELVRKFWGRHGGLMPRVEVKNEM